MLDWTGNGLIDDAIFLRSKTSKVPPAAGKKPAAPVVAARTGLVDTLTFSNSSFTPPPQVSTTPIPAGTPPSVKEVKKSQPKPEKQRRSDSFRLDSNSLPKSDNGHVRTEPKRVDQVLTKPDQPTGKIRNRPEHPPAVSKLDAPVKVNSNSTNKMEMPKQQYRSDLSPTKQESTNNHRSEASNHSRPDPVSSAIKADAIRTETTHVKSSPIQVRTDLAVTMVESNPSRTSSKVDSMKPRQDATKRPEGRPEVSSQPRVDFTHVKTDAEASKPEVMCTKSLIKPKSASSMGISLASSLASFVDSGLQWKADKSTSSTNSANEDPLARSNSAPKRDASSREASSREGSSKGEPNDVLEDQESLLQRDLAMVLDNWEEITQRKGEGTPLFFLFFFF